MRYHRLNGAEVARLREAMGVTQADLAERLGVTASMLSQIENGHKQPSPPVAFRLAALLGVKIPDIAEPVQAAS